MNNYTQWHTLPKCEAGEFYVFPRTVAQAYPTALNHEVCTKYEPMPRGDKVFTWVVAAIGICAMLAMAGG